MPLLVLGAIGVGTAIAGGCIDLGLFSVGCKTEQAISVRNKLEQKITNSIKQTTEANIIQSTTAINGIEIDNVDFTQCKDFRTDQKITGEIKYVANIGQNMASDIKQIMNESLNESIKVMSKEQTGFLEKAMNGKQVADLQNEVSQVIQNTVTQDALANILQTVTVGNSLVLKNSKLAGNACLINQDIALNVFSNAVIQQVVKNIMDIKLVQDIKTEVDLIKTKKSSYLWVYILLSVALLLLIIGLIYYFYKKQQMNTVKSVTSIVVPQQASAVKAQPIPTK
jgi:urease gamma subunit